MVNKELTKARAIYYGVFSKLFVYSTDTTEYFSLRDTLKILSDNPIDNTSKKALDSMLEKMEATSNVTLIQEFDDIFHNPTTSTIRTSVSFYDEGVESGKKRVEMQGFLAKTKIRRNEKTFTEYEDHFGFIFTVMSELLALVAEGDESYDNLTHCIFTEMLNPYIEEFIDEVQGHESAKIYKDAVLLLKVFVAFERAVLEVTPPKEKDEFEKIMEAHNKEEEISPEERERRARNKAAKLKDQLNQSCAIEADYDVERDI